MDEKVIHLPTDLPPGFRFHPSDEELIVHYLQKKVQSRPLPSSIIGDIDLYTYNPWDLPSKALFGEDEWYFFSPRDRKYPNGERPNRAAASGYWKATGTDKPIMSKNSESFCGRIGVKKGLVFYVGKPPRGSKTDWIMNEYRLLDTMSKGGSYVQKGSSMRLDEWVLCRVRQRGSNTRNVWDDRNSFTDNNGSPNSYFKSAKNDMQNLSSDSNQTIYGWPLGNNFDTNSKDDISSLMSSLTHTGTKTNQSELFRPSLKRKTLDDRPDNECIFFPSPVKIISGDEDGKNIGEGAMSTTSSSRYNINTAEDYWMKEFYLLDDEWNLLSETHQALLDFQ